MLFPWKTVLGLLIQHGPTVVSKVKSVMKEKTEKNIKVEIDERIHRLEAIIDQLNTQNDQLHQEIEQIRKENQNLQKIVQWLIFYVLIVSLVFLFWIIFSFK